MLSKIRQNFPKGPLFNYSVHIDPRGRFVFFNNAKCACSTLKATLNTAVAQDANIDLKLESLQDVHDRRKNPLLMPSAIGPDRFNEMLADPDVIKFAFVRETIPRLASAYASKFMRNSKQKQRFNTLVGRDHNADVSFDEFIHHVYANPAAQDSDEHWRLQSKQLSWGIVPFSFIGRFERFEADARRLLTMLFPDRDAPIFDVRAAFHANKSPSMKYAAAVQPEQAAMILTAYAPDEEMLAEIAKYEQQTS